MRGRQGSVQAQGTARVRIKIVEHEASLRAVRLPVEEDAGTHIALAGELLARRFAAVVVFHDQRRIAASGCCAETF